MPGKPSFISFGYQAAGRVTKRPMPCNTILVNPYPYILIAPVRVDFIPPSTTPGFFPLSLHTRDLCGLGALGAGGGTGAETVGELAVDGLEVTHAAGAGGLPALGLLAPVDCAALVSRGLGGWDVCLSVGVEQRGRSRTLPGLGSRVAARGAGVLLDVEGATTCGSH